MAVSLKTGAIPHLQGSIHATTHATHTRKTSQESCNQQPPRQRFSSTAETMLFEANTAIDHDILGTATDIPLEEQLAVLHDDPAYIEYICEKYPLLATRLVERTKLLARSVHRLAMRVEGDLPSLVRQFGFGEGSDTKLKRIHGTSGDSHNGGSRVAVIEFDGGGKVVYKPRSTAGEVTFQRYIAWINSHSAEWSFKTVNVWDRGEYGWMEYVEPMDVESRDEVIQYYKRYGAMVAALSFVGATDIHYENLVAHGAHPVILDLETILHPTEYAGEAGELPHIVMNLGYYVNTPLYTAMIDPAYLERSLNGSPLSLTLRSRQRYTRLVLTEDRKLVFDEERGDVLSGHLVSLNGAVVPYSDYVDAITSGYAACASLISVNRGELLDNVLDECFGGCTIRVIFRYTATYAAYLKALYSPYSLRSLRNSEEVLSKLWTSALAFSRQAPLVPSEYRDLWNGDIPFFLANVSVAVIGNASGDLFPCVIAKSGMATTRERLLDASIEKNRSDTRLIEFCLRTKAQANLNSVMHEVVEPTPLVTPTLPIEPRALLSLIAERLIVKDDHILFMDIVMGRDLRTSQMMLGQDFYTGLAGVCHALAYAFGTVSLDDNWRKIECIADIILLRSTEDARLELGACKGLGGFIYLASHLGALSGKKHYFDIADHLMSRVSRLLFTDRHFDVFSGAAGALLAACSLAEATHSGVALSRAEEFADHLLVHALRSNGRTVWKSSIPSSGPTTGFAHGASGIGYALLRAYRHLERPALLGAALETERFLADCMVAEQGRWKECADDSGPTNMDTWCHGLPGIARFYDELANVTGEARFGDVRRSALSLNAEVAEFENDSLCHGTMGNLDLLISHMGRDCDANMVVSRLAGEVGMRQSRCGNESFHTSLSLFNGLTGVAFQQLRAASQGSIPSVLCFEGPSHA